jgi:protocatechuate 3,4-dioxygenase, beta subunit
VESSSSLILTPRDWESNPPYLSPGYRSSILRSPSRPLIPLKENLKNRRVPVYGADDLGKLDHDLTRNGAKNGEPLGERIIVTGRVLDEGGRPVRNTLVEIWQANAAGRYVHGKDQHPAPLDPNFTGAGHVITDDQGRYRFVTIKPGAYPWKNHANAWRPNHLHFSLMGPAFATRLVTQMYFPGDPLIAIDPIANAVPQGALERLIARFDLAVTEPEWALGYVFDIVLRGRRATPMEQ